MWVFLSDAFFSIVEVKDRPESLLVRARFPDDIPRVFDCVGAKVQHTPDADYAYRAVIARDTVAFVISSEVNRIDYTNFKNSVTDEWRAHAYLNVWAHMASAQDQAVRRGRRSLGRARKPTPPAGPGQV